MAMKIRVHELAKELGKDNKDIVDYLTNKGILGKTAVSLVPEAEVIRLREMYGTKAAQESDSSIPEEKKETENAESPKKKKIIRVIRTQNAAGRIPQQKPAEKKDSARPLLQRPERQNTEKPAASAGIGLRKPSDKPSGIPIRRSTQNAAAAQPEKEVREKTADVVNAAQESVAKPDVTGSAESVRKAESAQEKTAAAKTQTASEMQTNEPALLKKEEAPVTGKESAANPSDSVGKEEQKKGTPKEEVKKEEAKSNLLTPEKPKIIIKRSYPELANPKKDTGKSGKNAGRDRSQSGKEDRRASSQGDRRRTGSQGKDRQGTAPFSKGTAQGTASAQNTRNGGAQGSTRSGKRFDAQAKPGDRNQTRDRVGTVRPGTDKKVFSVRHEVAPDSSLAHKTTRDFHGKDRDKLKNDRRSFEDAAGRSGGKKFNKVPKALQAQKPAKEAETKKEVVTEITLPEKITIRDLADKMKIQASQIIKNLFLKGEVVTVNHEVPFEKAQEIAMDYDIIAEMEEKEDVIGNLLAEAEEDEKDLMPRPPVVCVMGHVDHGKTSLLDAIRDTHVTDREAGGITQHIGAYMITINGQKITFLDTPGHEAFTAMRMRGANSTDIAVLVVAADDGVMPQTVEAINHAKAAGVEIIVAINKIDKPNANVDRVKQELTEYQLVPEDWGGQTIFCEVSAKTHEGIDNLLEMILLAAEVHELKANPNRKARGLVLEAKLDRGRGPVATILVQKGTLHQGDFIACGASYGKVRAMNDDKGKVVKKATPSMPVEIIGLSSVPGAGEVLVALDSDKDAKNFAATFVTENKKTLLEATQSQMSLDDLFSRIKEGNLKELPIIVKADVQGSVEAVTQSLVKLSNEEVVVKVIHGAVGNINDSDVNLAAASNALIVGFNVKADATARSIAEQNNIEIHLYSIIYQVIDDVERALKGMKAAVFEEKILGHAVIRQIFKASGVGNIAGSYVTDGIFKRKCKIRIHHGKDQIYEGELASLKRFKDDVKEVREGFECGLVFEGFGDFEVDDTVEAYEMVEVKDE